MKVAIVGAGMAGLGCARTLSQAGCEVVVFEKSKGVGGRVWTRRTQTEAGTFLWDVGATSITPRGKRLAEAIRQAVSPELTIPILDPIWIHSGMRTSAGDPHKNRVDRFTFRHGNQSLPKALAAGLNIQFEAQIDEIKRDDQKFRIGGETVDAVVLTPPIPQTSALLWGIGESRALANARYRSCISVQLGFAAPNPSVPYFALVEPEQVHPMTWLSLESKKAPDRAPEGHCAMVVQLSPRFSLDHYTKPDDFFIDTVLTFTKHLYGDAYCEPIVANAKRWKYSQPETLARFETVNTVGSRIVVASDALLGGRAEDAYEVGVMAAELLLK